MKFLGIISLLAATTTAYVVTDKPMGAAVEARHPVCRKVSWCSRSRTDYPNREVALWPWSLFAAAALLSMLVTIEVCPQSIILRVSILIRTSRQGTKGQQPSSGR